MVPLAQQCLIKSPYLVTQSHEVLELIADLWISSQLTLIPRHCASLFASEMRLKQSIVDVHANFGPVPTIGAALIGKALQPFLAHPLVDLACFSKRVRLDIRRVDVADRISSGVENLQHSLQA